MIKNNSQVDNRKLFRERCRVVLGAEAYRDIRLGGMSEEQKDSILLFLYMLKKFTGSTVISSLSDWTPK